MKYFAYGSLLDEAEMIKTCSGFKLIGKACLPGYRIDFTRYSRKWGAGVADIVKDETEEVWGLLYEISKDDLEVLNKREGHTNFYVKTEVTLLNEGGKKISAFSYKVKEKGSFESP